MNPDDTSNKSAHQDNAPATRDVSKDSWGPWLRPNQIVNSLKMQIRRIGRLSESDERARNSPRLFFLLFFFFFFTYQSGASTAHLHTRSEWQTISLRPLCARFPYISSVSIYLVDD